jgi:hypothetical protein
MSGKLRASYWTGPVPKRCELIGFVLNTAKHDDILETGEFVDGRIHDGDPRWANMCMRCYKRYGLGLGTGMGQRYTRQADGRWLKTGG